ncbi:unnamed protein product [Eruca vesicaria subsp. sativa]|uniref:SWI/SNF complex subunit SWI3D n=1 Tax=Eruca vesicaria subsp. sativa TaxID=29727 RepID=A0ABC8LAM9_ERUVS|nr:unnamed protein product [Eruca vesicaria subsp. sativa]
MEEKRRDAGTLASAGSSGDSPASEPAPRRRVKRKSNALGTSNSSSTSSKRMTREKAMLASFSPVHNGPLTRARQAPSNMASAAEVKSELLNAVSGTDGEKPKEEEERNKAIREWEALEAKIEADFEVIRSRGSNVHVVPNHCGWFSWGKIHPLEERSLPSFFNGKLEDRTSEVYTQIRDWIMRKFHYDPNTQIEVKDLTELEVGDAEAKQEVMEFLDYWGLINFHPFPQADESSGAGERDGLGDKESLLDSVYRFQTDDEARPAFVQKPPRLTAQATTPSGLFPDPVSADDSLKQEGPAVEYHCNSCSADCSLKRYHCPKQADFDLCTECFDSGKFSSDMSSSDFILLEPAKDPGVGSGKWTDQETLLLLEGLEIFKENWSEIAEHVATKTKAQCMLHFLQMPIEDAFLDQIDHKDPSIKDTTDVAAVSKDDKPVPKDAPEEKETENTNPVVEVETVKEAPEKEDENEGKVPQESSKPGDANEETNEVEAEQKTPKVEAVIDERCKDEAGENIALKALTEAFEDVGYPITPEASVSFADLGNPVMGLAAFLVRLAGSDVATASARASVKSLNSNSGLLLATRHCFVLEDPPENKDLTESKSVDAVGNDNSALDSSHTDGKSRKAEDVSLNLYDREMTDTDPGKVNQDSVSEEKQPGSLTGNSTRNPDSEGQKVSRNAAATKNSEKPRDIICTLQDKSLGKELAEPSKDGDKLSSGNKAASQATVSQAATDASQPEASKDVEMKDTLQSEKDPQNMVKTAGEEVEQAKEDVHSMPDTSVAEQPIGSASVQENGTEGKNPNKEGSKEKVVCAGTKDKHNSDRLKRAAISALSAAAVKAKHLSKLEEDQIRQLSGSLIEKQLHKLEAKLSIFNDAESVTARVREQLERSRQRLYHERAQIIASRLGVPPSVSSKASLPANRIAANFANVAQRPPMGMAFPRPPMPRPPGPGT